MNFIEQNYLWFIGTGIIIVMIIVGYIAEKTDFGHRKIEKQVKPKVEKIKKEKKEDKVEDLKNVKLGDVIYKDAVVPIKNDETPANGELSKEELEALSVPMEEEPTLQTLAEPQESTLSKEELEALSVPIGDTVVKEEAPIEKITELNQEENKEIEELKLEENKNSTSNEQPQEGNVWVDKPIEETQKDITNVESEEDIWKF